MAESCPLPRHLSTLPAWAGGGAGQDVGGDQPQSRQGALTTQLVTHQGEQRSISDLWLEADGIKGKNEVGSHGWALGMESLLILVCLLSGVHYSLQTSHTHTLS